MLLLVNALPAFVVLQIVPDRTKDWFVWTIQPDANARVLGVMYGNAFLLAAVAWLAPTWPRLRVAMAVVVPFSVAVTIVTPRDARPVPEAPVVRARVLARELRDPLCRGAARSSARGATWRRGAFRPKRR